jgi:prepilin-type N-terminal cleavage/methylation domain-containing protein
MNSVKRGFTLIELLVVIAIIGILSSIVLASLNTARIKSRDARRVADVKQLQLALQLFYDANSSYPTTTLAVLAPTYIATIPKDPVGQVGYFFDPMQVTGTGNAAVAASYHLGANLEDSTNQALQSDVDNLTTGTNLVTGSDAAGCVATVTTRYCYDVTP